MKKNIIPILLILVGCVGIYFVSQSSSTSDQGPAPVVIQEQAPRLEEHITVAVAKKDLAEKTVLTSNDFEIKTITINENSPARREFSLQDTGQNLANWAIISPIQQGSQIPVSLLAKPGSTEYISMFLQPGSVVYNFPIPNSDYYIFDNLKTGDEIDVYLAIDRIPVSGELVSPGNRQNIADLRLKPLMMKKRVLAIVNSTAIVDSKRKSSNQPALDGNDKIAVELTDRDLKVLKTLEGRAKFIVFPSVPPEVLEERLKEKGVEPGSIEQGDWPISDEDIFGGTTIKRLEG